MRYVVVFKEGASILKDGQLLKGRTKKEIISFWEKSENFIVGNFPIIFFQDGTIWDGILKYHFKQKKFWRNDNKKDVAKYVKERIKDELT
jgi:hypothetical protein